jgi:hypothetical protein
VAHRDARANARLYASARRGARPAHAHRALLPQEPNVVVQSPAFSSPAKAPSKAASKPAPARIASSFPSAGDDVDVKVPPSSCFPQHDAAERKSHSTALRLAVLVALGSAMGAGMHMYSSGSSSDAVKRCGYASVAEWRAAAAGEPRACAHARMCAPGGHPNAACPHAHAGLPSS